MLVEIMLSLFSNNKQLNQEFFKAFNKEANLEANDWEFLKTKWKTGTRFRKNLLYNGSANFLTRLQI